MKASSIVDVQVLQAFCWYGAVVLFKVLLMAPLTAVQRFRTKFDRLKTFISSEDAAGMRGAKAGTNEDIERVRRAHLNDLENCIPFILIGLLWIFHSKPSYATAVLHFQIFTVARIAHSIVYLLAVPQPARFLRKSTTSIG